MRQIGKILCVLAICLATGTWAASAQDKKKTTKAPAKPVPSKKAPKDPPPEDEPAAEEPAAEEPAAEEPAAEEPAADEPAADEPASDEPAGDEPPSDEPAPAGDEPPAEEYDMKTISYALGVNLGQRLANDLIDIDIDSMLEGLQHALKGEKLKVSAADIPKYVEAFQRNMQKQMQARFERESAEAKKAGEAYLAKNKKKPGVKTTASGLQYRVLSEGDGEVFPKPGNIVSAIYKGVFTDGKQFDGTEEGDPPIKFQLGAPRSVIAGWTEGLQLMHVGDKFELVLPAKLAYGMQGRDGIPPNSVLIFEIELVKIEQGSPLDSGDGEEAPAPEEDQPDDGSDIPADE